MSKIPVDLAYRCDICGRQRQASNHWVIAFQPQGADMHIIFKPWNDRLAAIDGAQHLCGRECATRLVDQTLEEFSKMESEATK